MPNYSYKAKDRSGSFVNGVLDAESRAAVSARLQTMGLFPIDIESKEKPAGALATLQRGRPARVKSVDLTSFYQQMSDLIGAGVPLVKALSTVKNQTTNPTLMAILGQVNADVQEGETFAGALDKHPQLFTNLTVALVRAGETGGLLDQTLQRISEYSEAQDELRSKVKSALAYPMIMVVVGVVAVGILMTFVMPRVMVIFDELGQDLPGPTVMMKTISDYLAAWWHATLVGIAAGIYLLRRYIHTERGGYQYDALMLKLPKFGEMLLKREIAGFARTLGSLLHNGVPILNALNIATEVMNSRPIRDEVKRIPDSITQGSGMAPALRGSKLFPPVVVNMVSIGEETGQLPHVLLRVATSYQTQVDRDIKTLTSFIEPLIILALGIVVGAIVIAMLLPIFSLDPTQGM